MTWVRARDGVREARKQSLNLHIASTIFIEEGYKFDASSSVGVWKIPRRTEYVAELRLH